MANKRIKGITIELDGSTKGLQDALSDVNKKSISLQSELRDVDKLLKFDPGNVEALAQKQQLLSQQIENTEDKLQRLKNAQEQVERQFASGDIGEEQYRAFRREIEYTEKNLNNLKSALKEVDSSNNIQGIKKDMDKLENSTENASEEVKGLGDELVNLAAGAAAVGTVGEAIEQALDISSFNTKIEISMDISEESKQAVKEASGIVESYGIDAEAALEGIRRQWSLNANASDEANSKIVQGAAAICAAYADIDFTELIQESNELAKSLNISDEEALGMINSLLKIGFPPDQLDIITEYGSQLQRAGYSAEEIQGIMAAGVETGTWNIDILLDGLKEGRIVLAEFGQGLDKETANLFNKVGISANQVEKWGQAVAEGGEGGKLAMQEVAKALSEIDDKTLQNQIGTKVFGTLWEENGTNITDTILGMSDNLGDAQSNMEGLNSSIDTLNSDPAVAMSQAISQIKLALEPVLLVIAKVISKLAEFMQAHPQISAAIVAIISVITIIIGVLTALAPLFTAVTAAAGAMGVSIGAIAAPVLIVIGVIAAIIAAGVLLYKNWDKIKAKAVELKNNIVKSFSQLKNINLFEIGKNIIAGLINGIKSKIAGVKQACSDIASSITKKIKGILGIHSPSKVLMEIGEYSGEGLVQGLDKKIKDVSAKSKELSESIVTSSKKSVKNNSFNIDYSKLNNSINYDQLTQCFIKSLEKMNLEIKVENNVLGKVTDKASGKRALLGERGLAIG